LVFDIWGIWYFGILFILVSWIFGVHRFLVSFELCVFGCLGWCRFVVLRFIVICLVGVALTLVVLSLVFRSFVVFDFSVFAVVDFGYLILFTWVWSIVVSVVLVVVFVVFSEV